MDYGFTHEGKVYTPNGSAVSVDATAARNAAIEAAELTAWSTCPDGTVGYATLASDRIDGPLKLGCHKPAPRIGEPVTVTTWLGTTIATGHVTGLSRGFHRARGLCISA